MPRIVYLSWPAGEISGGIKVDFQQVEMLIAHGFDAVVATADGKSPHWFASTGPVITLDAVQPTDVLVFPENHYALFDRFGPAPNPKLVFCQNPFYVHQGLNGRASFADTGATHIMAPSHSVLQFCERRFPGMQLGYTPFFIDHQRFTCPPHKLLQIACVPRKRLVEGGAIRDYFRACHPQWRGVPWKVLQNATEQEVAQVMGESAVFLSLARFEAHGVTALEAMASGCIVAGFSGVPGGSDSATAANGFWAAEDDVFGCADQLARAVQLVAGQGAHYQAMVASGRRTAGGYRKEEVTALVLGFWRRYLAETGLPT